MTATVHSAPNQAPSNFLFATVHWPEIAAEARRAERYAYGDPRSSVFYARRTIELVVNWLYRADSTLRYPYKDELSSLMFEPTFKQLVGEGMLQKLNLIRKQGNLAVHNVAPVTPNDSISVMRELYLVLAWLAHHYAKTDAGKPLLGSTFNAALLPKPQPGLAAKTFAELKKVSEGLAAADAKLAAAEGENAALTERLAALQAEIAAVKAQNATVVDTTDYREADTRTLYIDLLLKEAGWPLSDTRDREFPVTGMPNGGGAGFVDYVLWGEDGLPLGVVEAKRSGSDARVGKTQAALYADALERQTGQRPVIFYTNGFEHWIWDDTFYPPRRVDGFYTREQLALLVQRRSARHPLASLTVNPAIAGRYYQERAIRTIAESFEQRKERRALLVMATGSGKTRTVIALTDLLTRANWVKRVLFLADRTALVNQAVREFKEHLPDTSPVNLLTDKNPEARVFASTYQTMMGLIDQGGSGSADDGQKLFGSGAFDLIIIDEAHRSVYQKYGEIFSYFDALLVGLTATPKDEVDHNTYSLFGLEDGVPTDSYALADAIADGYLVPPVARPIALDFLNRGIRYDDLDEAERAEWDLIEWDDGLIPDEVDSAALNKWLFNADTVDKALEVLMQEGHRVAAGDRLGKTVVFAKNNVHAEFIVERFDANYPEYKGAFARVITYKSGPYAQSLIDDFSQTESAPHIAVSVDMLDTGIDVPDIVNLVFFKPVHSKTKYWQMIGRGTRLRPDLYGPGADKADFKIFDVCGNIAYFNSSGIGDATASVTPPLSARLFGARLALLGALGGQLIADSAECALHADVTRGLHAAVSGMNRDNFLVRRQLRLVEKFSDAAAWARMSEEERELMTRDVAGLPSPASVADNDELAKRFDLLALKAQLAVVAADGDAGFAAVRDRIRALAEALGEQKTIPAIAAHSELIDAVAGEDWWVDVTAPMIEQVRVRLRGLIRLIDAGPAKAIVYTDFTDTLGEYEPIDVVISSPGVDSARFRDKLHAFLRAHEHDLVMSKLRLGKQLTALDIEQLEQILLESGEFTAEELAAQAGESQGLGLLIRSIVGLDRSAATDALSDFVGQAGFTANQIAFVDLIVEHLTSRGTVDLDVLYEAPFTNYAPTGPEALFSPAQVQVLFGALRAVQATAIA